MYPTFDLIFFPDLLNYNNCMILIDPMMVWEIWVHVTTCQTPDCCRLIIEMIVPDCVNCDNHHI